MRENLDQTRDPVGDQVVMQSWIVRDLIGFGELHEVLGVSRTSAARYSNREDFPEPVESLSSGRVWRRRDVERWAAENPPGPQGRPPKSPGA